MKYSEVTRRKFLNDSMTVAAAVPFLALVGATACKDEPAQTATPEPADKPAEPAAAQGPICDVDKLPAAEKTKRDALGYIDQTTIPEKNCANCNLLVEDNGAGCAGCTLFAGPVALEGYCNSWVAKA